MTHEEKMELISEIADAVLRYIYPESILDVEEENSVLRYNEEAQEEYDNLYDLIEEVIDNYIKEK